MEERSAVAQLLTRARRRCFTHLLLEQSAVALAVGMGGAILLLLTGTQLLDWFWVALLAAASLGTGVYRLRKTIPSQYRLAQRIDRRLLLSDALSTATYFASPTANGDPIIRRKQHEEAESIARTIDPRAAVPFTRPRHLYYAAALAAVAFGLFALRYAVTRSLNLEPSLVKIAFDHFFSTKTEMAKAKQPRNPLKPPSDQSDPDSPTTQNDQAPDTPLDANENQEAANPDAADKSKEAAQKGRQDEQKEQQGENADKGDKQQTGNDADQQGPQNNRNDSKQGGKQDSKQGSQSENSSLMDKLKDAMSNMLNKMKSSQKDSQQQSAQNNQKAQQDKSGQQSKQGQSEKQSANADAQSDQQQSDSGDQKQSADAKGSEKSTDKNSSQDSKSGIGSADGDKAAKEAEQLKAMGKISEILGKRAQNVSGEVMVEVGSSKQQLKTPWAQRQAEHAEAGSEIHRDEVPLMYQQFVQQYFEEIRKSPESGKSKKN